MKKTLLIGMSLLAALVVEGRAQSNNIVVNGDFAIPLKQDKKRGNWNVLVLGSQSGAVDPLKDGFEVADGGLTVDLVKAGAQHGSAKGAIQLAQMIPALSVGKKYRLSFEAKASEEGRSVRVALGVPVAGLNMVGGLAWTEQPVTQELQPYTFEFEATEPPQESDPDKFTRVDIRVPTGEGTVTISNIDLSVVD